MSRVEVCLLFGQSLPARGIFLGAGLAVVLIDYILAFGLDVSDGDIEGEAIEVPALTLHFDDESEGVHMEVAACDDRCPVAGFARDGNRAEALSVLAFLHD